MNKINDFKLTTPVLYLVFNRLDCVKKTFIEIQMARPRQLFVACDGPRNEKEKIETDAVRKYVLDNVNWECEVKTLFRDNNLGCGTAVSSAIDWFFENVESGIIIEDDCLVDQSFFIFCQDMLEKYENNKRIMHIGGYNPLGKFNTNNSYLFSKNIYSWGWATWGKKWAKRDSEIYKKISKKTLREYWPNPIDRLFRKISIWHILENRVSVWDSQWNIQVRLNRGITIVPRHNLVKNIGFSNNSTHTKPNKWDKKYLDHERHNLKFPLKYHSSLKFDDKFDNTVLKMQVKRKFLKGVF